MHQGSFIAKNKSESLKKINNTNIVNDGIIIIDSKGAIGEARYVGVATRKRRKKRSKAKEKQRKMRETRHV